MPEDCMKELKQFHYKLTECLPSQATAKAK